MSKEAKAYHHKWIGDEKDLRDRYEVMQDYAEKYHEEQLLLHNVSSSLLSDLDYWKQRCELAEKCLEESPCDPDITSDQIKAHNAYNKFISHFGNDC